MNGATSTRFCIKSSLTLPAAVKKRIVECPEEAWKEIPTSLLDSLTRSMSRRVAAVIKAEG